MIIFQAVAPAGQSLSSDAILTSLHQGLDGNFCAKKGLVLFPDHMRLILKRGKPMDEMISYCGLVCQTCPIFLATRMEDKEEQAKARSEIAQMCKEQYGVNYSPEDITDCDGCRTKAGRLFSACLGCPIRNCASQKELENCAYCSDYACEKLDAFFGTDPKAKARLDEIKGTYFNR